MRDFPLGMRKNNNNNNNMTYTPATTLVIPHPPLASPIHINIIMLL